MGANDKSQYQQWALQAAKDKGVDPNIFMTLIQTESNWYQYNPDGSPNLNKQGSGAIGLGQIMPSSIPKPYTVADMENNPQLNLQVAAGILKDKIRAAIPPEERNNPNYQPTNQEMFVALSHYKGYGGADSQKYAAEVMQKAGIPPNSDGTYGGVDYGNPIAGGLSKYADAAQEVSGIDLDQATVDLLNPSYVVTDGLDNTPWYKLPGGVTQNPWLKQVDSPVVFEVQLPDGGLMRDKSNRPVILPLNASIHQFEIQYGHVINKTPSRTALHVTMWGQEADLISGEASTGAFMNAFGLTTFLSLSTITPEVREMIVKAFSREAVPYASSPNDLRIVARDAFMEFLSLFKSNGVVWFRDNTNYLSNGAIHNQYDASAFSPKTGASTYQMNARVNDVMARGNVLMRFRECIYSGYFKSLEYSIEAEHPHQWTFRFVFQVERTLTMYYTPPVQPKAEVIHPDSTPTIDYQSMQLLSLPGRSI